MEFDDYMRIAEAALPVLVTVLVAKHANRNSAHWSQWTGRIGKIVGLIVSLLDLAQTPKQYVSTIKRPKERKRQPNPAGKKTKVTRRVEE